MKTETLAKHIGGRVRALRLSRGWTQRDLASKLEMSGGEWTRARVGLLETDGVRADRLGDVLVLCSALDVGLETLLLGDSTDVVVNDQVWPVESLLAALRGPGTHTRPPRSEIDPSLIGASDRTAEARLAERVGLSYDDFDAMVRQIYLGVSASFARDAIAGLNEDTPKREAQARRGRASRKIEAAIHKGSADTHDLLRVQQLIETHKSRDGGP